MIRFNDNILIIEYGFTPHTSDTSPHHLTK